MENNLKFMKKHRKSPKMSKMSPRNLILRKVSISSLFRLILVIFSEKCQKTPRTFGTRDTAPPIDSENQENDHFFTDFRWFSVILTVFRGCSGATVDLQWVQWSHSGFTVGITAGRLPGPVPRWTTRIRTTPPYPHTRVPPWHHPAGQRCLAVQYSGWQRFARLLLVTVLNWKHQKVSFLDFSENIKKCHFWTFRKISKIYDISDILVKKDACLRLLLVKKLPFSSKTTVFSQFSHFRQNPLSPLAREALLVDK